MSTAIIDDIAAIRQRVEELRVLKEEARKDADDAAAGFFTISPTAYGSDRDPPSS